MIYTAKQFYDVTNTRSIPSWTRFDVGARYTFKLAVHTLALRAAVENVVDNDYWQSSARRSLSRGEPRTVKLTADASF